MLDRQTQVAPSSPQLAPTIECNCATPVRNNRTTLLRSCRPRTLMPSPGNVRPNCPWVRRCLSSNWKSICTGHLRFLGLSALQSDPVPIPLERLGGLPDADHLAVNPSQSHPWTCAAPTQRAGPRGTLYHELGDNPHLRKYRLARYTLSPLISANLHICPSHTPRAMHLLPTKGFHLRDSR